MSATFTTDPVVPMRGAWVRHALVGLPVWLVALFFLQGEWLWAEALLLFAALVIVPLGLALLHIEGEYARRFGWATPMVVMHALGAAALIASFVLPVGPPAGVLAVPWLAFTLFLALLGGLRFVTGGYVGGLPFIAALVFVPIGGVWTVQSRWGGELLGFGNPIALLTGVHFHYAGFALPILTGLAGGTLLSRLSVVALLGVLIGVPLVAVGITAGRSVPFIELAAAWFLGGACLIVALLQLQLARRTRHWPERLLFALSGLALVVGMALTAVYALGRYTQGDWLTIPTMIVWHGTINALGFALPALLAWHVELQRGRELQMVLPPLGGTPDLDGWEKRPVWYGVEEGPADRDRRDAYEREVGVEAPGAPEPDGVHRRAAAAVLRYDIFPPTFVRGVLRRAPLQVGDTVGILYHQAPGLDLFFAARVVAVFDEQRGDVWRSGFTYRTLVGHPEYGEETFSAEKDVASGRVIVALRSWSRPGTLLAQVFAPWVRRQQVRASHAALDHLARVAQAS